MTGNFGTFVKNNFFGIFKVISFCWKIIFILYYKNVLTYPIVATIYCIGKNIMVWWAIAEKTSLTILSLLVWSSKTAFFPIIKILTIIINVAEKIIRHLKHKFSTITIYDILKKSVFTLIYSMFLFSLYLNNKCIEYWLVLVITVTIDYRL